MPDPTRLQCRHIFTDGHRCGSPCLRREPFCFYHHTARPPKPRTPFTDLDDRFHLPALEDRSSIRAAIALVLQRIALCTLDSKRAGLLLYGLQIAALNLPKDPLPPPRILEEVVDEVVEDPVLGTVAPVAPLNAAAARAAAVNQAGTLAETLTDILQSRLTRIQAVAEELAPGPVPDTVPDTVPGAPSFAPLPHAKGGLSKNPAPGAGAPSFAPLPHAKGGLSKNPAPGAGAPSFAPLPHAKGGVSSNARPPFAATPPQIPQTPQRQRRGLYQPAAEGPGTRPPKPKG